MDYLRKATALYMRGEISSEEYIRKIKENPDRPDYEKIAERLWACRKEQLNDQEEA